MTDLSGFCNICRKEYLYLKKHMLTHDRGSHVCDMCDKTYSTKCSLLLHESRFHRPKIYECKKCDKSYSLRCDLHQHIKRVHISYRKKQYSIKKIREVIQEFIDYRLSKKRLKKDVPNVETNTLISEMADKEVLEFVDVLIPEIYTRDTSCVDIDLDNGMILRDIASPLD